MLTAMEPVQPAPTSTDDYIHVIVQEVRIYGRLIVLLPLVSNLLTRRRCHRRSSGCIMLMSTLIVPCYRACVVYLTPSALSVAVEGLFSVTGIIKNARSVAPYRLNKLCPVHDNDNYGKFIHCMMCSTLLSNEYRPVSYTHLTLPTIYSV